MDSFREALDLAQSEASIYVHLCIAGPAKAGDLATALKLHRNEVYRNTARLLQRGLVEMTMERPARYAAIRPEQVFERELAARLASIQSLKDARTRVLDMLQSLEPPEPSERRSVYKVIQGRQEIAAAQNHMLGHATRRVQWASTFPATVKLADVTGSLETLAARAKQGVRLEAALRTGTAGWRALRESVPGAELRELDIESDIRLMIVDERELLMWVVNDPTEGVKSKDEVAIQTTAPGFVQAQGVFFAQVWARAPPPA